MFLQSIFAAAVLSHARWSALKTCVQILRIQQFKVGSKKKKKKGRRVEIKKRSVTGTERPEVLAAAISIQLLKSIKKAYRNNLKVVTILLQNIQRLWLKINFSAAFFLFYFAAYELVKKNCYDRDSFTKQGYSVRTFSEPQRMQHNGKCS